MNRRKNDGRTIKKGDDSLESTYMVPYNPYLLVKFDAHINFEWCNQSQAIIYLFKYISKGNDRITGYLYLDDSTRKNGELLDESKMYYDCRYISTCEAMWRIFQFHINHKEPIIERLSFHIRNEQTMICHDDDQIDKVVKRNPDQSSMFIK